MLGVPPRALGEHGLAQAGVAALSIGPEGLAGPGSRWGWPDWGSSAGAVRARSSWAADLSGAALC